MFKKLIVLSLIISSFLAIHSASSQAVIGKATFYAKKFEGKRTSNGERFSHKKLTCATKRFKYGTYLKVTNLKNEKWVIVRVNDKMGARSPYQIDLTRKGAKILGFTGAGISKVKIEITDKEAYEKQFNELNIKP